ncbi:unnamed protein product [Durusdinium trenchii]|uniref:Rab-GAP TBC domain-containing protein n=1 Tax=Durusdinium trenchii TaxID=1381693 RepID=A0ABP0HYU9_9DINO
MTGAARADQWLAAAVASKKFERPDAVVAKNQVVSEEIHRQVDMDMARTYSKMLFGHQAPENEVVHRRQQVTNLMIKWLEGEETLTYMQGMNHVMATCFREIGEENAAMKVFDHVIPCRPTKTFSTRMATNFLLPIRAWRKSCVR